MSPRKLPSVLLLVFFITAINAVFIVQPASARTVHELQLQVNKVFNDSEEVVINLGLMNKQFANYENRNYFISMALYRLTDPTAFFINNNIDLSRSIPDSIVKNLKFIETWDESVVLNATKAVQVGKLKEGVYLAEAIYKHYIVRVPVFVSNYGIITRQVGKDALAFVANQQDGKALTKFKAFLGSDGGSMLTEAKEYKRGIARFTQPDSFFSHNNNLPVIIIYDEDKAIASSSFIQNLQHQSQENPGCRGYVFTDRPVYRPQQWVRFQGIFRERSGRSFRVVNDSLFWRISNVKGQETAKGRAKLDQNGNFSDSVFLEENAALGDWSISVDLKTIKFNYKATFSVEEYKKPEFIVTVKPDKNHYKAGDKISSTIEAKYFFGSVVSNAQVMYQVIKKPVPVVPQTRDDSFSWMDENSANDGKKNNSYNTYSQSSSQTIVTTGNARLDKDGKCRVTFSTRGSSGTNDNYTIIAYVTDASRRSISASASCTVSYDDIRISAYAAKNYFKPGEDIIITAKAADFSGKATGAKIKTGLYNFPKNRNTAAITENECFTNKENGEAIIKLKARNAGRYYAKIKAWEIKENQNIPASATASADGNEIQFPNVQLRPVHVSINVDVLDTVSAFNMWYRNQNDRNTIRIITDKQDYRPGEKIEALVYVPFGADAFITVNNNLLGDYNSFSFPGGNDVYGTDSGACREIKMEVMADVCGQVQFYVAAMRNGVLKQNSQLIRVLPEEKLLNIAVVFDKEKYKPGTKAKAKIKVTDKEGKAVGNANISLVTADESIYAISPDKTPDIRKIFYGYQPNQSHTKYNHSGFNVLAKGSAASLQGQAWRRANIGNKYKNKTYLGDNDWYQLLYSKDITTSIEGYIISQENGLPVPNAAVEVGGNIFYADKTGYYYISGFNPALSIIDIVFSNPKKASNKLSILGLKLNETQKTELNVAIPAVSSHQIRLNSTISGTENKTVFSAFFWDGGTEMAGKISVGHQNEATIKIYLRDPLNNQQLDHATIRLFSEDGNQKYSCITDEKGECSFKKVKRGNFFLSAAYLDYRQQYIEGIGFSDKKSMEIKVAMNEEFNFHNKSSVEVTAFRKPLYTKDQHATGGTITREEIQRSPYRNMNSMAATVAGVYSSGGTPNIRGQRSNGTIYFVDGVRVVGNYSVPQSAIERTGAGYPYNSGGKRSVVNSIIYPDFEEALAFNEATIRANFRDVIYWGNTVITDENGEAEIEISLPDNLTAWQTTARVITDDAKVGQAIANFTVRKELLVRMETPRFITHGDTLLIATNIHNYLDEEKTVKVILEADGVMVNGTEKTIKVPANSEKRIDWKVENNSLTKVKFTVKALTNSESDAMYAEVPVQPYGLQVSEPLLVETSSNKSRKISFEIPKEVDIRSAKLEVNISPSIAAAMLSSMNSLIAYPYGCVEQTMSRFIPLVLAVSTFKTLDGEYQPAFNPEELKKMVGTGTKRLAELQNADGSWGWWSRDQANPFMTAYVCYGLNLARRAGYYINDDSYQKGLNSLSNQIRGGTKTDPQSYAYQVMVAMQCGQKSLWRQSKKMPSANDNAYTKALWLQAAHYADDKAMAKELIKSLEEAATWDGNFVSWQKVRTKNNENQYYHSWQNDPVEATANAIKALLMTDPENKLITPAVRWIMEKRAGASWHNTRQTAMCIFALNDLIKKELTSDYRLEILTNSKPAGNMTVSGKDIFKIGRTISFTSAPLFAGTEAGIGMDSASSLHYGTNTIEIKQEGEGQWYLSAQLNYYLHLADNQTGKLEETRKNNLFGAERTYYSIVSRRDGNGNMVYKKKTLNPKDIKPGDDILVKVKVSAKSRQEYVLIEDPIPAGCEFIRETKGYIIDGEKLQNINDDKANSSNNSWYNHREMRDNKLALMVSTLQPGEYEYSYLLKAQIPGNYRITPVVVQLMYYPEKRGFSKFYKMAIK